MRVFFVSVSQENYQFLTALLEVHPVTGTVVDSQLRNTCAIRRNIARVSHCEPLDPRLNARVRLEVAQIVEPLIKEDGFVNFDRKAVL